MFCFGFLFLFLFVCLFVCFFRNDRMFSVVIVTCTSVLVDCFTLHIIHWRYVFQWSYIVAEYCTYTRIQVLEIIFWYFCGRTNSTTPKYTGAHFWLAHVTYIYKIVNTVQCKNNIQLILAALLVALGKKKISTNYP